MPAVAMELSSENFAALYSGCHLKLLRYVLTLLPDRHLADDVVQDVARLLWKKRRHYDPSRPFFPWARGFAHLQVLKVLKRKSVDGKYFSEHLVEQIAEEQVAQEEQLSAQREALAKCLRKLDASSHELLMLRYGGQMTVQEMAEREGKSANALYISIHRIRQTLVECVNRTLRLEGWT